MNLLHHAHSRASEVVSLGVQVAPPAVVSLWHLFGKAVPVTVGVLTIIYTAIQIARGVIALRAEWKART